MPTGVAPPDSSTVDEAEAESRIRALRPNSTAQLVYKRVRSSVLVVTGFLLSPLSPWNDAWINIPIAYIVARLVAIIARGLFLPSFIVAYWASNLLGLLMMHAGGSSMLRRRSGAKSYLMWAAASLAYTAVIFAISQLRPIQP